MKTLREEIRIDIPSKIYTQSLTFFATEKRRWSTREKVIMEIDKQIVGNIWGLIWDKIEK